MFVEAAFFRFCEGILLGDDVGRSTLGRYDWTEEQIRGLFAQSIIDELSSRLIKYPSLCVHTEKRYPLSWDLPKSLSVDIHAHFSREVLTTDLGDYGFSDQNWIEIKYFSSRNSRKSSPAKTENMASIMKDILRLIVLTDAKKLGRYLIIVFDNEPRKYLAMKNAKYGEREWLGKLFDEKSAAEKETHIDFSLETNSFFDKIGSSRKISNVSLTLYSQTFVPRIDERYFDKKQLNDDRQLIYSYLFRIDDFDINFGERRIPAASDKESYDLCRDLARDLWAGKGKKASNEGSKGS